MKHVATREFFAHWDQARGTALAPDRVDLAPEPVRHLLADVFVLATDTPEYPFRVAGTRVCALTGRDLKNESFTALFEGASRTEVADLVAVVADETLPTIAGVTAAAADGRTVPMELLLLPFSARAHTPTSLTGILVPFEQGTLPLTSFQLTTWRHIHPPRLVSPRMMRRWATLRGFTVYEGFR
ncbi:MAG: PAS domain-containing protein [Pseudomonadota bacterium]|jgi:hypothetical protein